MHQFVTDSALNKNCRFSFRFHRFLYCDLRREQHAFVFVFLTFCIQNRLHHYQTVSHNMDQRATAILSYTPKITDPGPRKERCGDCEKHCRHEPWKHCSDIRLLNDVVMLRGPAESGCTKEKRTKTGYDLAAFKAAGLDWATMKTAGFTLEEVIAAGCDLPMAHSAGFDFLLLLQTFGYDAVASLGIDAGYTLV